MRILTKVETVGDAIIVASGVPTRNGHDHSREIAMVALDMLLVVTQTDIPHFPGEHPLMRVGINTGTEIFSYLKIIKIQIGGTPDRMAGSRPQHPACIL